MIGWIKLHRSILENDIWMDKPFARGQAWVDLLLMANYEDHEYLLGSQKINVKAGEIITSMTKLADRWGWSTKKVGMFLDGLESVGMLQQKRNSKYTSIFIVNWAFYQSAEDGEETQKKNKRKSKENQKKTYKNIKKDKKVISIGALQRDYDFDEIEKALAGRI